MPKKSISISVRYLVEAVMMTGDLLALPSVTKRMKEGTVTHQHVQKSRGSDYKAEVPLSLQIERPLISLKITGRMDGLYEAGLFTPIGDANPIPVIEEIKSYRSEVESIAPTVGDRHWAQLKLYGYMYLTQVNQEPNDKKLKEIDLSLVYVRVSDLEEVRFDERWSLDDLENYFFSLADEFFRREEILLEWEQIRNLKNGEIPFPFTEIREGQDTLMDEVSSHLEDGGLLFAEAPTGIGKTLGTLYPAVRAQAREQVGKIFYLTAKTSGKTIAQDACSILIEGGCRIKTCVITAKGKICFKDRVYCHPEYCEYARGYYDRIATALEALFSHGHANRELITNLAREHKICPYEFSLDFALLADVIICDYNYLFDPRVYLRRFFMVGKKDYCFLVDEAHNLVDRARGMYSASLSKRPVLTLQRFFKERAKAGKNKNIADEFKKLNKWFIDQKKLCLIEENSTIIKGAPDEEFIEQLETLAEKLDRMFTKYGVLEVVDQESPSFETGNILLDFWFNLKAFLQINKNYTPGYRYYITSGSGDVRVKLFCLDPSALITKIIERGKCSVFFSATLRPMEYFRDLLGGDETSQLLSLDSPFPRRNKLVLINPSINTRYRHREGSYHRIAEEIRILVQAKAVNSLIFFPSYKYLEEVLALFVEKAPETRVLAQEASMTEEEREEFLESFHGEDGLTGFVVMGGVFGEGIDLLGEKLSNAVIVGVGLPAINLENNILKSFFQETRDRGFNYAYIYPGMNRVMQAAGRVIRSESDRGVILFLDDRFINYQYKYLFPESWQADAIISGEEDLKKLVTNFWRTDVPENR